VKNSLNPRIFATVIDALIHSDAKSVAKILDTGNGKTVVRATWRFKPSARSRCEEIVVTFGAPNYVDRQFMKRCKAAHDDLSILDLQVRAWPKKRNKK
jgi:hypothetical protein